MSEFFFIAIISVLGSLLLNHLQIKNPKNAIFIGWVIGLSQVIGIISVIYFFNH